MHIAQLCPPNEFYSPTQGGAVATVIMNLTAELVRRGHQVSVLAPTGDEASYDVGDVRPVLPAIRDRLTASQRMYSRLFAPLHGWSHQGGQRQRGGRYYHHYARSVERQMRRLSPPPEVVLTHNDPSAPLLAHRAAPGARVFHWMHNEPDVAALSRTMEHVERFLCVSEYLGGVARLRGVPAERLATVLHGVESDRFYPRPDYLELREPIRIVFVGRLSPSKGADLLVKAVGQVRGQGWPVSLTVVGSKWWFDHHRAQRDSYYAELMELVHSMPGVEALGHVDRFDLPAVIRAHDVACVPSRWEEPAGLVNLEAMASGCALIATRRGGIPELTGDAAILVEPKVTPLAEALLTLVRDPAVLRRRKEQAVARAAEMSWAATVDRLEALIGGG